MMRLNPVFSLYVLGLAYIVFILLVILSIGELVVLPEGFFKWYLALTVLFMFWWPIDLLLHWEKKTETSMRKDKVISCLALTIILFLVPYHWFAQPLLPSLGFAITVGIVIPIIISLLVYTKDKRITIQPGAIYRMGMKSPRAEEFLKYFPDARQFVFGITAKDGNRGHFVLHKRVPCDCLEGAKIDYVLDISVDRKLGSYIAGKEKLQCYLFRNDGSHAGVGFLPCSNIGRALDYGFSEEELEKAVDEASTLDQNWAAIGNDPILIQHYPGKVLRMK